MIVERKRSFGRTLHVADPYAKIKKRIEKEGVGMKKDRDAIFTYLWKDRKRILGMPISFTKYALTEDRLFERTGFLNLKYEEILLYRIRDISLRLPLGQRLFGVGTIMVHSSDQSRPHMEIKRVKRPMEVKELLHKQVEEMKLARRMRVGEILDDVDVEESDGDDPCRD